MIKTIILIGLLWCVALPSIASKIYKWVDENGQVHYGEKPPVETTKANEVEVNTRPQPSQSANSPSERLQKQQELIRAYSEERRNREEVKEKKSKKKQKLKRNCKIAKNRYKDYLRSNRIYKNDKDGNRVYLSDEKRDEAVKNYKKEIDKHCN